ncbi:hypothetical protein ACQKWADRAFT_319251 [Trichoderma austrokoningii]
METDEENMKEYFAILQQQRLLLKQAQTYKGQKPPASFKRSRSVLQRDFYLAALRTGMRNLMAQPHQVRSCFIGEAYPPCTMPLSSLVPIHIRDLKLETQHRGHVLIVRTFCEPDYLASVQNAIEDESGEVNRLAIYNLLPTTDPNAVLPKGAIVAIKEPYYKCTADGGVIVRVDHPTDFELLKPGHGMIPRGFNARIMQIGQTAMHLKDEANAKFSSGDFREAIEIYSDALDACDPGEDDDELRRDLHRNRAAANLRLGRYEPAMKDAMASLISAQDISEAAKALNLKALYRAGKAAYGLQDFAQAKRLFDQALELDGSHKETQIELTRTAKRIAEQENGEYDFSLMSKLAPRQHYFLDNASFLRRVKVVQTENRGRGLFATEALKPGDVIFVEKAFYVAHPNGGDTSVLFNVNTDRISVGVQGRCLYGIIDKLIWNPTLANKYADLWDGGKFGNNNDKEFKVIDGRAAVDTFRVQAIVELNSFGYRRDHCRGKKPQSDERLSSNESVGIWLQASYTNHSCISNATRAFIGDMMVVRASRDIPAGGEIFMAYHNPEKPLDERQKIFADHYGFQCACDLCRADGKVPKATLAKRARLRAEIDSFMTTFASQNGSRKNCSDSKKAEAKKLLKELRATYPKAQFERLPRLECLELGYWMAVSATGSIGNVQEKLADLLEILRDAGYFISIQGGNVTVDQTAAVHYNSVTHVAIYASQFLTVAGKRGAACALLVLAREAYIAMLGSDERFVKEFMLGCGIIGA